MYFLTGFVLSPAAAWVEIDSSIAEVLLLWLLVVVFDSMNKFVCIELSFNISEIVIYVIDFTVQLY